MDVRKSLAAVSIIASSSAALVRPDPVVIGLAVATLLCVVGWAIVQSLERDVAVGAASDGSTFYAGVSPFASGILNAMKEDEEMTRQQLRQLAGKAKPDIASSVPRETVTVTKVQAEAIELSRLLRDGYKLPLKVPWRSRKDAIVDTPRYYLYRLEQAGSFALSELANRTDDIARDIMRLSRHGKGDPVRVFVIDSQPVYLQVSKPTAAPHLWENRRPSKRPLLATIGTYWEGPQAEQVDLDLAGEDTDFANGLFWGRPGSGKSTDIHAGLLSLLECTKPGALEVYAYDAKNNAYAPYLGLPHVKEASNSIDAVMACLYRLNDLCLAEGWDGVHRLLILDEFHMFMRDPARGPEFAELMWGIMTRGRSAGIRVWIATQVPDNSTVPSEMKAIIHFFVISHIAKDLYMKKVLGIYGAAKVESKREFVFDTSGMTRVASKFYLPKEELAQRIAALKAKWPGIERGSPGIEAGIRVHLPTRIGDQGGDRHRGSPGIVIGDRNSTRAADTQTDLFPIKPARELTEAEAWAAYQLHLDGMGINAMQRKVFGGEKSSIRRQYILNALSLGKELAEVNNAGRL